MPITESQVLSSVNTRIDGYLANDQEPPQELLGYRANLLGSGVGDSSTPVISVWTTGTVPSGALATASQMLAADPNRKMVIFTNNTNGIVYLRFGAGDASAAAGGHNEVVPAGFRIQLVPEARFRISVIAVGATAALGYSVGA